MNFYKRFPGDYGSKTGHLSLAEHGAYTLMLDVQYSTERGLPSDLQALYRLCRAMTKPEQQAVQSVAEQFFPVGENGMRFNSRAESEIEAAAPAIESARVNGKKGGRPKNIPKNKPIGFPSGNPNGTQNEPTPKASQSQSQSQIHSGIQPEVVLKNSVCVPPHTQISDEFRTAAKAMRPELDADLVFRNFAGYYPPGKQTLPKWQQWLKNERAPMADVSHVTVPGTTQPDPELARLERESLLAVPVPDAIREYRAGLKNAKAEA